MPKNPKMTKIYDIQGGAEGTFVIQLTLSKSSALGVSFFSRFSRCGFPPAGFWFGRPPRPPRARRNGLLSRCCRGGLFFRPSRLLTGAIGTSPKISIRIDFPSSGTPEIEKPGLNKLLQHSKTQIRTYFHAIEGQIMLAC